MKFSNLQCYTYEAPFKHPIKTVKADLETRKVLVISLEVAGHTYYAESNAFETDWYHVETIDTVFCLSSIYMSRLKQVNGRITLNSGHYWHRFAVPLMRWRSLTISAGRV